ncbi:hypothetical protein RND81_09G016700 [Saponaria officinalis]|uniref:Peptidase A1 domain-containing protein n=1 Tax=Saponaria officinalis TaxID=3572 RepID=A0AAW1IHM7_SAPOF
MTKIPFSSPMNLIPCLILLLITCMISIPSEGLRLTLVPPYSPESPAYLSNLTISKKIQKLINQSKGRAQVLNSSLFPTKNSNQTSPYGESKRIFSPIDGTNLGGASGYAYAAKIGIGQFKNGPLYKTYYLSLDTGSTLTWLQCEKCQTGGNTCFPQVDPLYENSLSTSYEPLMENNPMCISAPPNPNPNKLCSYDIEYADGAQTKGQMASEIFTFETTYSTQLVGLVFGCGFDQKGFRVKEGVPEKAAGILGLGRGKEAFHMQLDYRHIGLSFSYCFQDLLNQGGGQQRPTYLYFGENPHDYPFTFQETPFQVVANNPLYYVRLISINIGNIPVTMPPVDKVIIDTGSSISYLFKPAYESMVKTLVSWLNRRRIPPRILHSNDLTDDPTFCFAKKPNQGYGILPTIHFMLEGDGEFKIAPEQGFVVWKDDPQGEEYFCLMIEPHDTLSIIGAFQQVNHKFIYDIGRNKLLFLNKNCAYAH